MANCATNIVNGGGYKVGMGEGFGGAADSVASWGAALRSRAAGSQDESRCSTIHKQRPYPASRHALAIATERPRRGGAETRPYRKSRRRREATFGWRRSLRPRARMAAVPTWVSSSIRGMIWAFSLASEAARSQIACMAKVFTMLLLSRR